MGPRWGDRTESRRYTGPAGWSLPRRAADLAALEKVEVVKIAREVGRLRTRERVLVSATGTPRELARYWQRLDEIAEAVNAANGAGGWWLGRALGMPIDVWRS